MGTVFINVKDLASYAKLHSEQQVLLAELLVLEALEWDLNLITPAHYVATDDAFIFLEDELDWICKFMVVGVHPYFRPSVIAAVLTNDPRLLPLCSQSDIEAAHRAFLLEKDSTPNAVVCVCE